MITPEQIAKPNTESAHQQALIQACALARREGRLLETEWLYHVPNGRDRNPIDAAMLKAEGVKAGVADLELPCSRRGFAGLHIEMKKPSERTAKNGGLSDKQITFCEFVHKEGRKVTACYSWEEAFTVIRWYLGEIN